MTAFNDHIENAQAATAKAEYHLQCAENLTRQVLINNRIELTAYHIARARVQVLLARRYKEV